MEVPAAPGNPDLEYGLTREGIDFDAPMANTTT